MRVPRRTFLACVFALSACAAAWADGEYTAARMPGSNVLWTAGRTAEEIGKHTNNGTIHLTEEQTAKIAVAITSAPPQSVTSVMGKTGDVSIAAADLGALTNEQDLAALAAIATNRVAELYGEKFIFRIQNGTGTLYTVPIIGTNFIITLSNDFLETNGGTRPGWTNHVFPFTDGAWHGVNNGNYLSIDFNGATWWMGGDSIVYPYSVNPGGPDAQGQAWISIASFVYGTNRTFYGSLAFQSYVDGLASTQSVHEVSDKADDAQSAADFAQGDINNHAGSASAHNGLFVKANNGGATNLAAYGGLTLNGKSVATTAAPVWISVTNAVGAVTVTNDLERPVTLYATGDVTVAFAGLRAPLPVWLEAWAEGTATVSFADAYAVGGFSWQTNRVNLFAVWSSGTNTFVTPITTRSKE